MNCTVRRNKRWFELLFMILLICLKDINAIMDAQFSPFKNSMRLSCFKPHRHSVFIVQFPFRHE